MVAGWRRVKVRLGVRRVVMIMVVVVQLLVIVIVGMTRNMDVGSPVEVHFFLLFYLSCRGCFYYCVVRVSARTTFERRERRNYGAHSGPDMNLSRLDRDSVTNSRTLAGRIRPVRHSAHSTPQLLFPSNSVSTNPVCLFVCLCVRPSWRRSLEEEEEEDEKAQEGERERQSLSAAASEREVRILY